jgi:hypothetical protein
MDSGQIYQRSVIIGVERFAHSEASLWPRSTISSDTTQFRPSSDHFKRDRLGCVRSPEPSLAALMFSASIQKMSRPDDIYSKHSPFFRTLDQTTNGRGQRID